MARNISSFFTRLQWPGELRKTCAELGTVCIALFSTIKLSFKRESIFLTKIFFLPGCNFLNRPAKDRFRIKTLLKTN
jgi:hypothetical protein